MKVRFLTEEVAGLMEPLLRGRVLDHALSGNPSALRAANTIIKRQTEHTELRRADLVFTTLGRPDYLHLLKEVT